MPTNLDQLKSCVHEGRQLYSKYHDNYVLFVDTLLFVGILLQERQKYYLGLKIHGMLGYESFMKVL